MKTLFTVLFSFLTISCFCQEDLCDSYQLNFDINYSINHLSFVNKTNHKNIWQLGAPNKKIFTSTFSKQNVIVTDTINSYPVNDTSVFIITNVGCMEGFDWPHTVSLHGRYYVDSDTLKDYGKIEFSPDNGKKWIDLLNDSILIDTLYDHYWCWDTFGYNDNPVLTGDSKGWKDFDVELAMLGHFYGVRMGDTVQYRFTFISDSIQTNKDGLMYDDFYFMDYAEGIDDIPTGNTVSIYPNPSSDQLFIRTNREIVKQSVQIIDCTGRVVFTDMNFTKNAIHVGQLNNGIYVLKYGDGNNFATKIFIVQHE